MRRLLITTTLFGALLATGAAPAAATERVGVVVWETASLAPAQPEDPAAAPVPVAPAPAPQPVSVEESGPVEPASPVDEAGPVEAPEAEAPELEPTVEEHAPEAVESPVAETTPQPVEPAPVEPPAPQPNEPEPVEPEPEPDQPRPDDQHQEAQQVSSTVQDAEATADAPGAAVAVNVAETLQDIWQVQVGCLSFCVATTQQQSAAQSAVAEQAATAVAGAAVNAAVTVQAIFQLQIGCLFSCFATVQEQVAAQAAATVQEATAHSPPPRDGQTGATIGERELDELARAVWDAVAAAIVLETVVASNESTVVQRIVQAQIGCRSDCHDTVQRQAAVQIAAGVQSAVADAAIAALVTWLREQLADRAVAANESSTQQLIRMLQVASCLTRCSGAAQVQEAVQIAYTQQSAAARGRRVKRPRAAGRTARIRAYELRDHPHRRDRPGRS